MADPPKRVLSYGGGVQTFAMLAMIANGDLERPDLVIMADTGSEMQATYRHVEEVAKPLARSAGLEWADVCSPNGPLHEFTKWGACPIPCYGCRGGMAFRICTERWKIRPINTWLRLNGMRPAEVWLGISLDEAHRMKDSADKWKTHRWPLVEKRMTRQDCIAYPERHGLAVPGKSACFMCPLRRMSEWTKMREQEPEEFERAALVEDSLNGMFLTPTRKPIREAVGRQHGMFQDDECGGYCWT
jgi:hypothetical protein